MSPWSDRHVEYAPTLVSIATAMGVPTHQVTDYWHHRVRAWLAEGCTRAAAELGALEDVGARFSKGSA